ncbi:hypothetical protein JF732_18840 [Mycobacterium intracellulare]|uniref:4Fe-4S Wbl-type domain-containing protein n=1 Tax=Mycobacterium intracellulare TaxID=1767 RepID=A0AAE4UCR7_MYCIT|nr:hypothetical protein [Mycobacterium intracellulare]MCA2320705.1 hypothetical protein [Mycobacterium intracellulare]MCA2342599.1 hypothetical protein [Mycobacterium intracellulare]MDV6978186.1 hypothetical protein [Mycobacterium intracellulare]MDV6983613.1 hypothetical protein [Mycobacterium intracellulare]MDV7013692.1 hypothetical protein [Mycobacterium intracellulare]
MSAWEDLAGALAGVPLLEGARCKGRPERFDLDIRSHREAIDWATYTCGACPALRKCRRWVDSLPSRQWPSGVVGGRLFDAAAYQSAQAVMAAELKPQAPKAARRSRGARRPARRLLVAAEAVGAAGLTAREAAVVLYGAEVTLNHVELARQCLQRLVRRGRLRRVDRGQAGVRGRVSRYVIVDLEAVAS